MPLALRRTHPLAGLLGLVTSASLACATCGPNAEGPAKNPPTATPEQPRADGRITLDLFAFGRVLGAIAPCGCTTEPLGGLQYVFGYIAHNADPARRVVVEPGSLLFPDPKGPEAPHDEAAWAQAEQRASALQARLAALGDDVVSGVGPTDLSGPAGRESLRTWALPRVLANSRALDGQGVRPHALVDVAGLDGKPALQVGVTAVIEPALATAAGLQDAEAIEVAAAREVAAMRAAGAELTVVLVHGTRGAAVLIAEKVEGADLVVVGIPEGQEKTRLGAPATRVGHSYVLEPAEQAQTLAHVRLSIDPAALAKLPAPAAWTVLATDEAKNKELARLDARLAKFRADPSADAAYLARLEQERAALAASLDAAPVVEGPVAVTFEQAKITCKLPADSDGEAALRAYDSWVAEQNQKRFAGVEPPKPAKGQAGYVGAEQCGACHDEALAQWRTTRHFGAYDTLVAANKQFDLSCVGCHVTGFRQPGGSEVVELNDLETVQCEVCHGPGSLHVAQPEKQGKPFGIRREAAVDVCTTCHTPEHSDTFEYEAYLRDVLGAGHGAARRAMLGEGPTGRELRSAALEKAGGGCKHNKPAAP